jgi:hypothetical protein
MNNIQTLENSPKTLPTFQTAQAWYGPQLKANPEQWVHQLDDAQVSELDKVVRQADARGLDITQLKSEDFSFSTLNSLLKKVETTVLDGIGVFLIRGIPVEQYTIRQSAIAFWALGTKLGLPVSQNGKGHVLGHVANLGLDYADPAVRGYQTSSRLPYHTDSSDMVGLLCVKSAKAGGLSSVVSSTTVWNELVARYPKHAHTLLEDFHRTRWGEIPKDQKPYTSNPIFVPYKGRLFANYVRSAIRKAQIMPSVPRLTEAQNEAMDRLDGLASDAALYLDMEFKPGDVQLVSNFSIFHSRTAYEDWPEADKRRHLLRLWLACGHGPEIPESLLRRNGVTENGRPNGIEVPGVKHFAPLSPE